MSEPQDATEAAGGRSDSTEVLGQANEDRKTTLLRAAYALLKECKQGPYVKDALGTVVFYDGVECDGECLMEDIAIELEIDEYA